LRALETFEALATRLSPSPEVEAVRTALDSLSFGAALVALESVAQTLASAS